MFIAVCMVCSGSYSYSYSSDKYKINKYSCIIPRGHNSQKPCTRLYNLLNLEKIVTKNCNLVETAVICYMQGDVLSCDILCDLKKQ